MYTNKDLRKLLIPLMIEQVLTSLMGTADTLMVARLGETSVSGVSCVDSINKLVIFLLASIATGGTIVCSQFIGKGDKKNTDEAARQVLLASFGISLVLMLFCFVLRKWLLNIIFGSVEAAVMDSALDYFKITAISYPFVAIFNSAASIYRAGGNSRLPMLISAGGNVLNIAGNYILLFVLHTGVSGAAWATTGSMAVNAAVIICFLRFKNNPVDIGRLYMIRPRFRLMLKVIRVGVPTGIENSMFQFGKLIVQSTVATLGTMAIASNAVVVALELVTSMPSQGIAIGLITVAGQCIGAGRLDEAIANIKKLTLWAAVVLFVWNWIIFFFTMPVCRLAGLDEATCALTFSVMLLISIVKPFLWPLSFLPPNGMRAAGDAAFSMITATLSMWICRVGLTTVLCRFMGAGLTGIWCGYFLDWAVRSVVNVLRFRSGRWASHKVID